MQPPNVLITLTRALELCILRRNRLLFVRALIMQLPIVQSALFLALNVVFVEDYVRFVWSEESENVPAL